MIFSIKSLEKYEEPDGDVIDKDELNKNIEILDFIDEVARDSKGEENGLDLSKNYSTEQMEKGLPKREKVIQENELTDLKIILETSDDVEDFLKKI